MQTSFIKGFLKRASEYGVEREQATQLLKEALSKSEAYDYKASVPLNTVFAASPPGVAIGAIKDLVSPHDIPSRLTNIHLPALAGLLGGGAVGVGVDTATNANHPILAALVGGGLGGLWGGALGTDLYNQKIDDLLQRKDRPWEESSRIRLGL